MTLSKIAAIAAPALLSLTALVAPPKAEATTLCDSISGLDFCVTPGTRSDSVNISYGNLREQITIVCDGRTRDWGFESYGNFSQAEIEQFVEGYCSGRGYVHY